MPGPSNFILGGAGKLDGNSGEIPAILMTRSAQPNTLLGKTAVTVSASDGRECEKGEELGLINNSYRVRCAINHSFQGRKEGIKWA